MGVYRPYDYRHRCIRAALLAAMRDGDPCFRCGEPMWLADAHRIHADHSVPVALGGRDPDVLSHGSCNESHGATMGNRMRGRGEVVERPVKPVRPAVLVTSREW